MGRRADTDDYRTLFLRDAPMVDLRAPLEFAQGAFPTAQSLPLMTDDERAQVGTCYKKSGQQAAIELGHALVGGEVREQRLADWQRFTQQHPEGYIYCFRGGLRSQTVQQWLADAGYDYPLVLGGYKAMRRFLIDELERSVVTANLVLIAGRTGTGKTRVIEALSRAADLEGLARHRGSAFGSLLDPQPSQIDFENALSIALLKLLDADEQAPLFLEDEGRLIGRLYLPEVLRERMAQAPLYVVEEDLEKRIDVVIDDYIHDLGTRFLRAHGDEQGPLQHRDKLLADVDRIRKRLGGELHKQVGQLLNKAFEQHWASGNIEGHRAWIEILLSRYYDPMYDYQFSKREGEVRFRGDRAAVIDAAHRAR